MAQQSPGATKTSNLKQLLDELGSASDDARLQLHLLALETRQRTGEFSTKLEKLERELDRSFHQALSTATERARQLSKVMQASLGLEPSTRSPAKRSGQLRVRAIMTEPVHACNEDDTLHAAAQIMWDHDCGAVPVTDQQGRLRGIVTDRDICMAAYTKGMPLQHIRVGDVMAQPVHTCSPDDTLERTIAVMADAQVRRLPIIDQERKLVGIVSLADVALHAALLGRREAETLVLRLLGTLSKPRRKNGTLAAE